MEKFRFKSIEDLCMEAIREYDAIRDDKEFYGVNIVARYDIIIDALNWLANNTVFELYCINIEPPEIDWYEGEYTLSLQDKELWCERSKRGDTYLITENPTFVHADCNSQFAIKNHGLVMYEFTVAEDEDECVCCPHCNNEDYIVLSKDDDGNTHGFTRSWSDGYAYGSFSFYSTDLDMVRAELNKFCK